MDLVVTIISTVYFLKCCPFLASVSSQYVCVSVFVMSWCVFAVFQADICRFLQQIKLATFFSRFAVFWVADKEHGRWVSS